MACETCQDCNCDNVTLPVVVGPSGSAGATGSDGADGIDGVAVLHNDLVQSTTTSASMNAFTTDKTYTLPVNTLSTDGSKIIITALFQIQDNLAALGDAADVSVFFNGSNYTSIPLRINAAGIETGSFAKLRLEVSRISSTSILIHTDFYISDDTNGASVNHKHFPTLSTTVSDLTTSTTVINLRGLTSVGTLNCNQYTIDHLIK